MKTFRFVFLLSLFFLLAACKKDKDEAAPLQGGQGPIGATLKNTLWLCRTTSNNDWEGYFYFGRDTLITSNDSITWTPTSSYFTNLNLFYICDFSPLVCFPGDTGEYHFSVVSDTLRFTSVSDGCGLRSGYLNAHYFIRL